MVRINFKAMIETHNLVFKMLVFIFGSYKSYNLTWVCYFSCLHRVILWEV